VIYLACIVRHYLYSDDAVSLTTLLLYYATKRTEKCVYPNTVVKIECKSFSVLVWHGIY